MTAPHHMTGVCSDLFWKVTPPHSSLSSAGVKNNLSWKIYIQNYFNIPGVVNGKGPQWAACIWSREKSLRIRHLPGGKWGSLSGRALTGLQGRYAGSAEAYSSEGILSQMQLGVPCTESNMTPSPSNIDTCKIRVKYIDYSCLSPSLSTQFHHYFSFFLETESLSLWEIYFEQIIQTNNRLNILFSKQLWVLQKAKTRVKMRMLPIIFFDTTHKHNLILMSSLAKLKCHPDPVIRPSPGQLSVLQRTAAEYLWPCPCHEPVIFLN